MITGDTPFDDTELIGILRKHISQTPPRLRDLTNTPIPDQLETAVAKMLEKDPNKRYQSIREVHAVLDAIRFPEAAIEQIPSSAPTRKLTRAMMLWWGAVLTVPILFGFIFLIPYMAQKFDEQTPAVPPPPVVSNKQPTKEQALKKFKMDWVEFDEPGKNKYMVTKSGDVVITDEDLQFIGEAMKGNGKTPCQGIDLSSFIEVKGNGIKGDGIKYLRGLGVECINLQGAKLDPIGYKYLGEIPSLHELSLEKSNITDQDAASLETSKGIWILNLSNCKNISDKALRSVAKIKDLTKLDLIGTNVSDAGMQWLSHCPELKRIYFEGTKIGDQGLKNLSPCPKLFDLHLVQCRNVTGDGLKFITKTWPRLSFLEIGGDTEIKPEDLECLRNNQRIHHLNVVGIPVSDKELQIFASMPRLSELYISKGTFPPESLKHFYSLKNLKTVTLLGCKDLTKESISELRNVLSKSVKDVGVICPVDDSQLDGEFKEMYFSETQVNARDDLSSESQTNPSNASPVDSSNSSKVSPPASSKASPVDSSKVSPADYTRVSPASNSAD